MLTFPILIFTAGLPDQINWCRNMFLCTRWILLNSKASPPNLQLIHFRPDKSQRWLPQLQSHAWWSESPEGEMYKGCAPHLADDEDRMFHWICKFKQLMMLVWNIVESGNRKVEMKCGQIFWEYLTQGSVDGSFGDCRKQQRMAAKFVNKCKQQSCPGGHDIGRWWW